MSVTITSMTPFRIRATAYRLAREALEKFREETRGVDLAYPLAEECEDADTIFVTAADSAGQDVLRTPATTTGEIALKLEIFIIEGMIECPGETGKDLLQCIAADAKRIGGAL